MVYKLMLVNKNNTLNNTGLAHGKVVTEEWILGKTYPPQQLAVNDTIVFSWSASSFHGLFMIRDRNCPPQFIDNHNGQMEIAAAQPGPMSANYTFTSPGTYYFACPVSGHCAAGMLQEVIVSK